MLDLAEAEYLSIPGFLKAYPREEGGRRLVYLEASNEARDLQGERVLAKALADSSDYYARYGNLDIDHLTQTGARSGVPDYLMYEVGRPSEVRVQGDRTFVKGEIYKGHGAAAEKANQFWASLTEITPPKRWYPSVGGQVTGRSTEFDPATRSTVTLIKSVRWTNIGFSATPVNPTVPTVSTVPFDVLAKCWTIGGFDLSKSDGAAAPAGLTAGYGTDSASLSGGAALRSQSLDHRLQSYWDFREAIAGDLRGGKCGPSAEHITEHAASHYGLPRAQAADWAGRFMGGLRADLARKKRGH